MPAEPGTKLIKFQASSPEYDEPKTITKGSDEGADMIEQRALVVSVEGGYAWVLPQRESKGCSACSAKSSCSSSSPFDFMRKEPQQMRVLNPVYARPGESVIIGMQGDALVLYSLLAYLLPLVGMVLAAILGHGLLALANIEGEAGVILAALAGLFGGLRLGNLISARSLHNKGFQPVILRAKGQPIYSSFIPSS